MTDPFAVGPRRRTFSSAWPIAYVPFSDGAERGQRSRLSDWGAEAELPHRAALGNVAGRSPWWLPRAVRLSSGFDEGCQLPAAMWSRISVMMSSMSVATRSVVMSAGSGVGSAASASSPPMMFARFVRTSNSAAQPSRAWA